MNIKNVNKEAGFQRLRQSCARRGVIIQNTKAQRDQYDQLYKLVTTNVNTGRYDVGVIANRLAEQGLHNTEYNIRKAVDFAVQAGMFLLMGLSPTDKNISKRTADQRQYELYPLDTTDPREQQENKDLRLRAIADGVSLLHVELKGERVKYEKDEHGKTRKALGKADMTTSRDEGYNSQYDQFNPEPNLGKAFDYQDPNADDADMSEDIGHRDEDGVFTFDPKFKKEIDETTRDFGEIFDRGDAERILRGARDDEDYKRRLEHIIKTALPDDSDWTKMSDRDKNMILDYGLVAAPVDDTDDAMGDEKIEVAVLDDKGNPILDENGEPKTRKIYSEREAKYQSAKEIANEYGMDPGQYSRLLNKIMKKLSGEG